MQSECRARRKAKSILVEAESFAHPALLSMLRTFKPRLLHFARPFFVVYFFLPHVSPPTNSKLKTKLMR
jgi:hypothetical protein